MSQVLVEHVNQKLAELSVTSSPASFLRDPSFDIFYRDVDGTLVASYIDFYMYTLRPPSINLYNRRYTDYVESLEVNWSLGYRKARNDLQKLQAEFCGQQDSVRAMSKDLENKYRECLYSRASYFLEVLSRRMLADYLGEEKDSVLLKIAPFQQEEYFSVYLKRKELGRRLKTLSIDCVKSAREEMKGADDDLAQLIEKISVYIATYRRQAMIEACSKGSSPRTVEVGAVVKKRFKQQNRSIFMKQRHQDRIEKLEALKARNLANPHQYGNHGRLPVGPNVIQALKNAHDSCVDHLFEDD